MKNSYQSSVVSRRICISYLALVLILLGTASSRAQTEVEMNRKIGEVAHELVCLCGCGNLVLDVCTCEVAKKEKNRIKRYLKAGKTKQEIIDLFIADVSEKARNYVRRYIEAGTPPQGTIITQKDLKKIDRMIDLGKTKQEIMDKYYAEKGWVVLAAPPKEGILNQILWVVVPYFLPVVFLVILSYYLWKWVKKKDDSDQAGLEEKWEEEDADYNSKLEDELSHFDE